MYVSKICAEGIFKNFPLWLKNVKSRSKIALFSNYARHFEIRFPKRKTIMFYWIKLSKLHKQGPILHVTTSFSLKQGETRTNSVPIPHPLMCRTRRFSNHESRLLSRAHTFAIIVTWNLKIHQSMWIHWSFFPKTWTKGHWPLHDLWPHVCWDPMCDSTQGSSPMTIHQWMWIQWSILQITTYIHILRTYYILRTEWVIT